MKDGKHVYRFRDGLTGQFISEKRAKQLSKKRVIRERIR